MSIRSVLRIGHPSLRGRSTEIPDDWFGSQRLQALVDDLFDTKAACSGAGIAAPQIGEPWRVFVLGMKHNPRYPEAPPLPERVVINPAFKAIGEESTTFWEGCLSVPGLRGEVKRSKYIRLQYQDQEGISHQEELEGFHAYLPGTYVPRWLESLQRRWTLGIRDVPPTQLSKHTHTYV